MCISARNTVNDKSYKRKALWFCGFSINHKSFPYECFEQWQNFQYGEAKTTKVFPLRLNLVNCETFSLAYINQLLSFTVTVGHCPFFEHLTDQSLFQISHTFFNGTEM